MHHHPLTLAGFCRQHFNYGRSLYLCRRRIARRARRPVQGRDAVVLSRTADVPHPAGGRPGGMVLQPAFRAVTGRDRRRCRARMDGWGRIFEGADGGRDGEGAGVSDPRMSVVLATDRYETIRPVVLRLLRQTIRDQLEIVIVESSGRAGSRGRPPRASGDSPVSSLLSVESLRPPWGHARAAGVRAATAPLVFIGETHTYPHPGVGRPPGRCLHTRPGWRSPPASTMRIPGTALSWAIFLLDYGEWLHAAPLRERSAVVPTHNAAFDRDVLLELGPGSGAGPGPRRPARQCASDSAGYRVLLRTGREDRPPERQAVSPSWMQGAVSGRAAWWEAAGPRRWSGGSAADLFLRVATHPGRCCSSACGPAGGAPSEAPRLCLWAPCRRLVAGAVISAVGEMLGYAPGGRPGAPSGRMAGGNEVHKVRYSRAGR